MPIASLKLIIMNRQRRAEEKMLKYIYSHTGFPYVLLAGALVSFLDPDPDGDGRVPLPFFGRTVPLFTVGRNGRVAIIGLAGRKRTT